MRAIFQNNFSRNKLEESNKNLVLQIAELKSDKVKTKTEIETARNFLKQLTEKYANLKTEVRPKFLQYKAHFSNWYFSRAYPI